MNLLRRWLQFVQEPLPEVGEKPRAADRLALEVQVECRQGHREFLGWVHEISSQGMRLSVSVPLRAEDTLQIQSVDKPRQHVLGRVAWVRGRYPQWEVGIQFNPSDQNVYQGWLDQARSQPSS